MVIPLFLYAESLRQSDVHMHAKRHTIGKGASRVSYYNLGQCNTILIYYIRKL